MKIKIAVISLLGFALLAANATILRSQA